MAAHADRYTAQLAEALARHRTAPMLRQHLHRRARHRAERDRLAREAIHFGVLNLGEVLSPATVEAVVSGAHGRLLSRRDVVGRVDAHRGAAGIVEALAHQLPVIRGLPETRWLARRLDALHRMLPEAVVRAGGMGKVVRAMAGVLTIAAVDTLDTPPDDAREHLARVLPAAYAFGAAYAIVDDTLLDLPGGHVTPADRDRYGAMIAHGLATGEPADLVELPDHPLAEELHRLQAVLLDRYPFAAHRPLYRAAESMYLAQHRDATAPAPTDPAQRYPDLVVAAGMSRVVANLLARRALPDRFYARCVNTVFVSQLRDDLIDRDADRRAGRHTPFTVPPAAGADPLYDLFAYNAYVADVVYGGDPAATDALTAYSAARLAAHLSAGPDRAEALIREYGPAPEIARFLRLAGGLPPRTARRLAAVDQRVRDGAARVLAARAPTAVDCRTFVADRLPYINEVVARHLPPDDGELGRIIRYVMDGQGKRLRPALSLMLAEALHVDPVTVEPVIAAGELFHTASLVFDDLPAQDDAAVRRGRPAAHLVFDEGSVQLAALSMISTGFALLSRLDQWYPARKVTEVVAYAGAALGPDRLCRGQHLDLRMSAPRGDGEPPPALDEILLMYELKTSAALDAALVPLLMILDRPAGQIAAMRGYARHAGIVFQLRDDILDATSTTEALGKAAGADTEKINVVRAYGLAEARGLVRDHLAAAVDCCRRLPFDTALLECMARHFATRRR